MNNSGQFILSISVVLSLYTFISLFLSLKFEDFNFYKSSKVSSVITSVLLFLSFLILLFSFLNHDFSLKIVMENSRKGMSLFSLLTSILVPETVFLFLWAFCISLITSFRLVFGAIRKDNIVSLIVLSFLLIFFLAVIVTASNPFELSESIPKNGKGLYPGLYYPELVIHTITLILSFSGFSCVYSDSVASLFFSNDNRKVDYNRRLICVSWFLLFTSILSGGKWAAMLSDWGGFWTFDIVENIILIPFLLSTALLHSVIIQKKRGMLKRWNVILITVIYMFILLSCYITRSAKFTSAHSFSNSSTANYFLLLFILLSVLSAVLIYKGKKSLKSDNRLDSFLSRECTFLINNLLFASMAFTLFWGILIQIFEKAGFIKEIGLGPLFFNKILTFLGLLVIVLTALCTALSWRRTSVNKVIKILSLPVLLSFLVTILHIYKFNLNGTFLRVTVFFYILLFFVTIIEFFKGFRFFGKSNLISSVFKLVYRYNYRYGGYLIHIGFMFVIVGISASFYASKITDIEIKAGKKKSVAGYEFQFEKISTSQLYPDVSLNLIAQVKLYENELFLKSLSPAIEIYEDWKRYKRVSVFESFRENIFIRWKSYAEDRTSVFNIKIVPLASMIIIGWFITLFGFLIVVFK